MNVEMKWALVRIEILFYGNKKSLEGDLQFRGLIWDYMIYLRTLDFMLGVPFLSASNKNKIRKKIKRAIAIVLYWNQNLNPPIQRPFIELQFIHLT